MYRYYNKYKSLLLSTVLRLQDFRSFQVSAGPASLQAPWIFQTPDRVGDCELLLASPKHMTIFKEIIIRHQILHEKTVLEEEFDQSDTDI